jgi:hypothetical protein
MTGNHQPPSLRRIRRTRALTPITSLIVTVVVLALVGVVAYGIMGGLSPAHSQTCEPASAPQCASYLHLDDVSLILPFKSIQQGGLATFTTSLPAGETATSFSFNFGDGSPVLHSQAPTVTHTFNAPGTFLITVVAEVAGSPQNHDNFHSILPLTVTPSFASDPNQTLPTLTGTTVTNSSPMASGIPPSGVLTVGSSITIHASYTNAPANPLYQEVPPSLKLPAGVVETNNSTSTSLTAKLTFDQPGIYVATIVGGSTNHSGSSVPTAYQNYSWTVFVPPSGKTAAVFAQAPPRSPHPGKLLVYELLPGGARTEDPAIAYDTGSYEPIENVYQPLISYNGTSSGPDSSDFVPVLSTCVPGPNSGSCNALYGDPLYHGYNYTFVVNGASKFYDPTTGASWGVYPTDVLFSIARTLGFADQPCVGCNNGWILAQSLLSTGNANWSTIHSPYNNTPSAVFASMSINDSLCQSLSGAMTTDHGCITFHANGHGLAWPYFLELIADPLGGSIVPCGWFSADRQEAGIPFWTGGNSSGAGDHPCAMPGQGGYGILPSQMPATGWDVWETIGSGATGKFGGNVRYNMVGTGPYYMAQYSVGIQYTVQASPAYSQNPHCTWSTCYPAPGTYASQVQVTWETEATEGENAYASGTADLATVPPTDLAFLLQLISQGKATALTNPTLSIGFSPFNLNFNVNAADHYTTEPVNIPPDFFSYLGMRQFFVHTYPYATIESTIETRYGIVLGINYGGAIPQYMANYYPRDINWPSGDPCTDQLNPNCAAYWWAQMHNVSGPYYDSEVFACTASNPCYFPNFGTTGNPAGDEILNLWENAVATASGGAISMPYIDINFNNVLLNSESPAGSNPMPIFGLGWAPDYPDPTDYVIPLYYPNATYTEGDAVAQGLFTAAFGASCGHSTSDINFFANTSFGQNCQGTAYKAMLNLLGAAAVAPVGPNRGMLYDLAERIANHLALYTYTNQGNGLANAASWIDINSLNINVTIGAGGATPYFWIQGNGVAG